MSDWNKGTSQKYVIDIYLDSLCNFLQLPSKWKNGLNCPFNIIGNIWIYWGNIESSGRPPWLIICNVFFSKYFSCPFCDSFWWRTDDDNQAQALYVCENSHCAPLFRLNTPLTRNWRTRFEMIFFSTQLVVSFFFWCFQIWLKYSSKFWQRWENKNLYDRPRQTEAQWVVRTFYWSNLSQVSFVVITKQGGKALSEKETRLDTFHQKFELIRQIIAFSQPLGYLLVISERICLAHTLSCRSRRLTDFMKNLK